MKRSAFAKTLFAILLSSSLLLPFLPAALAVPSAPTTLTPGVTGSRNLSGLSSPTVDAIAGNVTELTIEALAVTQSWQGYYGNVSGTMLLQDAANNSLYEWSNGTATGEIYATRTDTMTWGAINCSNATVIAAEESYLGQSATDADSVNKTFNATSHPSFIVGTRNMTGCPSTNTFVSGAAQSADYHEILLADDAGNIAYTALIDAGATGYDGAAHDFQLLVGENGHLGDTSVTAYYFWTELG